MNKLCLVYLVLLLSVHLASEVVGDNTTSATTSSPNSTTTKNSTNVAGTREPVTLLLLPLALGATLLHSLP